MKRTLLIFTFLTITMASYCQEKQSMENFDPAFVHTVFFWLNNPESDADRSKFEASLSKFLKNSDFAKTNFIGTPPSASRDVVDGSFTYSLVLTFESADAQQKYQEEPAHLLFIEESSSLWNKVIVYDSMGIGK